MNQEINQKAANPTEWKKW